MTSAFDVARQFATRPTLRQVATATLRDGLLELYPALHIDPQLAAIALIGKPVAPAPSGSGQAKTLTDCLLEHFAAQATVEWTALQHGVFASVQVRTSLPVDVTSIGALVDRLALGLLDNFKLALIDYWRGCGEPGDACPSRWAWLAARVKQQLRDGLDATPALTSDPVMRQILADVVLFPVRVEREQRPASLSSSSRVCIVHLQFNDDIGEGGMLPALVMFKGQSGREQVGMYQLSGRCDYWQSLSDWQQSLRQQWGEQAGSGELHWTAYTPDEDIFDVVTQAILDNQLVEVQRLTRANAYDIDHLERSLTAVTDVCALFLPAQGVADQPVTLNIQRLPQWLKEASEADRTDYAKRLSALAVTQKRANGQAFNDGLAPIVEFANQSLTDCVHQDHPQGVDFSLKQIQVRIDVVTGSTLAFGGQPVAVGSIEPVYLSAAGFALENLAGLPVGRITLQRLDAQPLPDWMNGDYLKQLTVRADIGQAYPYLIKRYLLTDSGERLRRQALFAEQLHAQLPLQALEQKIKGELGTAGYQAVCAIMNTAPAAQPGAMSTIVLRPLAFVRAAGHRADVVANMFIIGPLDIASGPHVLYRPFADVSLIEFANLAALMAAIRQPGVLQDDILVWLSDAARPIYANGGFAEPHIVRFGLGSDFGPLTTPPPAELSDAVVGDDVMLVLYRANALALIELADHQAVSNAENRWKTLKEGGWLLLDTLLPLVGGVAANVLWLAQLLMDVEQALSAPATQDAKARSAMLANLLLNLSLVLLHNGLALRTLAGWKAQAPHLASTESAIASQPLTIRQSPAMEGRLLEDAPTVLDFSWSQPVNRLSAHQRRELARFTLAPARVSGEAVQTGLHAGLYQDGDRWLARVGADVFRVIAEVEGVRVVAADNPLLAGPWLKRDGGHWQLDMDLRLRGGGPKKNLRQLSEQNAANLTRIRGSLALLREREVVLQDKVVGYTRQLNTLTGEVRQLFFERLESTVTELIDIIQQRLALWQQMRVGDRPPERELAQELNRTAKHAVLIEGVLSNDNATITQNALVQMRVSGRGVNEQNFDVYTDMFKHILIKQEKGIHWSKVRESYWVQLRAVPKVGEALWREQALMLHASNLLSGLEWKAQYMLSNLELCLGRESFFEPDQFSRLKGLRSGEGLHGALASHAELEKPNDYSLTVGIDVLESALIEYYKAREIANEVDAAQFAPLQSPYLETFKRSINELCETTEARLSAMIQENVEPPPAPAEYMPRIVQPHKRIIRTRNQRSLVGDLREGQEDFPGEVADVRNMQTGQIISSWHQHADESWVEIKIATPPEAPPSRLSTPSAELRSRAQLLLQDVDRSINKARLQSTRAYEPEDIEDILLIKAGKLEGLADQMSARAEDPQTPAPLSSQLSSEAGQLRDGAARLTAEGRAIRIQMIKTQPPTAARVSYLYRQREIDISSFDGRKNISGAKRNDFLQEFAIRDKNHQLLWWAHFHYSTESASAQAFTAAHLKLPEQRRLGYKALIRAARDGKEVVNIYRSSISKDIAQRLFPGPQSATPE